MFSRPAVVCVTRVRQPLSRAHTRNFQVVKVSSADIGVSSSITRYAYVTRFLHTPSSNQIRYYRKPFPCWQTSKKWWRAKARYAKKKKKQPVRFLRSNYFSGDTLRKKKPVGTPLEKFLRVFIEIWRVPFVFLEPFTKNRGLICFLAFLFSTLCPTTVMRSFAPDKFPSRGKYFLNLKHFIQNWWLIHNKHVLYVRTEINSNFQINVIIVFYRKL